MFPAFGLGNRGGLRRPRHHRNTSTEEARVFAYSAWQDAMYSDVYRCWGRYGYLVAWEQFGDYLDFYEGIFGSERLKDYDSIYNNAPTGMETDDEAGYYVDEVLALAEKNNADMIFN